MKELTEIKTCGRDPSCDLVLEHPTVSRRHASIELAEDGLVRLLDDGSSNGMFLNRSDRWIRAGRVTLCIGDRVKFGEYEVPIEQITAVFGRRSNARLESRHFMPVSGNGAAAGDAVTRESGAVFKKPRRNPVTGKIEGE